VTDQADKILAVLGVEAMTTRQLRRAYKSAGWHWSMSTDEALLSLRMAGDVVVTPVGWRAKGLTERME